MNNFDKILRLGTINKYFGNIQINNITIRLYKDDYIDIVVGNKTYFREIRYFGAKKYKRLFQLVNSYQHTPTKKLLQQICSLVGISFERLFAVDPKKGCLNSHGIKIISKATKDLQDIAHTYESELYNLASKYQQQIMAFKKNHCESLEIMKLSKIPTELSLSGAKHILKQLRSLIGPLKKELDNEEQSK